MIRNILDSRIITKHESHDRTTTLALQLLRARHVEKEIGPGLHKECN